MAEDELRRTLLLEFQQELSVLVDADDPITGSDEQIVDQLLKKLKNRNRWSVFAGLYLALAVIWLWYIVIVLGREEMNGFMPLFFLVSSGFIVGYGLGIRKGSRVIERCITVISAERPRQ